MKYLLNRNIICVSKNCFSHTYFLTCSHFPQRHRAHPGALAGSWLGWDQGCQMPGSHRTSSVASYKFWKRSFAILVTTVWSICLEISLTSWAESPSVGSCSVNFFPHFGCLSSPSLPSCWEGRLAHRMCCDLAAIPLLSEHSFFFPKESSAQGLYHHLCLLLTNQPCEAYQGAGCQPCQKYHICQCFTQF